MSVIRMIYVTFPPDLAQQAEQNWKQHCGPLMIKQPGCLSEQLLRCNSAPGEYISWSEWDAEASIDKYLKSEAHQEIKRQNRNILGASVTVKHYAQVR